MSELLLAKMRVYLAQAAEIKQLYGRLQDLQEQHHILEQEIDGILAEEDKS